VLPNVHYKLIWGSTVVNPLVACHGDLVLKVPTRMMGADSGDFERRSHFSSVNDRDSTPNTIALS
jgi:hypothetical protein